MLQKPKKSTVMIETLRQFKAQESLFDAASALLEKLGIKFNAETTSPIPVSALYNGPMPQYLTDALQFIDYTYFIGVANDLSLQGQHESTSLEEVAETFERGGKYNGMFIFACDTKPGANLTRTAAAALTRAFNRLASANPVILVIRQDNQLSLATCEHMEYTQEWRQGTGEKIGKVSILRNINCDHPHRGHLDILQQLVSDSCDTFEKLYKHWMKVFNSELLTQNFYNDLFNWYQWAVNPEAKVSFPNDPTVQEDDREDIDTKVIRLITRLMFVWFIKQKGLVPSEIFDESYVASILNDFDSQSTTSGTYYNAIIQNLFFGTLNRPIIEDGEVRGFAESNEQDCKNLYRYEELFSISKQEVIDMFATVPFLNCGLFECQDKNATFDGVERRFYNDGFSRNAAKFKDGTYKYRAVVPNILFFEPTRGLLSIFNKYVFTIEENTPQDVQVALDPELLGKVFENLLGAYNPETQETARNQSGSFYTPREIVQYMVNESLVAHLKRTVGEELEPQYRQLMDFSEMHVELSEKQKHDILHSLFTCKILDPACGSGAFPMGMLQQMVHILRQVDPDNTQWKDVLLNMAVDESRRAFGIDNEEERQKKLLEIERTFDENLKSPDYTRKLYIIESCIYGVDIQPIAMLITRLRFFISLICEQTDIRRDDPEHNFGIKTLPNLESKFVAANTLIDADIHKYNEDWTANPVLMQLKNELLAIRRRHFYTRKRNEKKRLRKQDNVMREKIHQCITKLVGEPDEGRIALFRDIKAKAEAELTQYLEENWVEETQAVPASLFDENPQTQVVTVDKNKPKRLELQQRIKKCDEDIQRELNKTVPSGFEAAVLEVTKWNPYDQNSVSPFFDLEWMFGITDGFDMVIGNPPYIQLQKDGGSYATLYEHSGYKTFARTGDIYCLFYERGWQLLKEAGLLCYITSNKWMRAGYGEKTREFFANNTNPMLLIDFAGVKIFESATVDTNILLLAKDQNQHETMCAITNKQSKDSITNLSVFVQQHHSICDFAGSDSWVILSDIEQSIKRKIEAVGTPLKDWDIQINYGIKTGYNDAFIISTEKRDEILANCATDDERERTAELIRPILRGRDIKRYGYDWAGLWLINTHNGVKGLKPRIDVNEYPAVKEHLDKYWDKISTRADKGDTPYNLRNCAYVDLFYKPKICWKAVGRNLTFSIINPGTFLTAPASFISANKYNHYITAFLCSKVGRYFIYQNSDTTGAGDIMLNIQSLIRFPIPKPESLEAQEEIDKLVKDQMSKYSTEVQDQLDCLIYKLYHFNSHEIEEIECR
jgi:type I restriction-modification system DNA methylase subunit